MNLLFKKHPDVNIQMIDMDMIHLVVSKNFKVNLRLEVRFDDYHKSNKLLIEEYKSIILKGENEELKSLENKYTHPVFYKLKERIYDVKSSYTKEIYFSSTYEEYIYKRYHLMDAMINFDNRINKSFSYIQELESDNSFLSKFFNNKLNKEMKNHQDLMKKKDDYIDRYFKQYFNFFKEKFTVLKLPKDLLDKLIQNTLLSIRFDVMKTATILDNLIEKIYTFFSLTNNAKGNRMFDKVVDESIQDFTEYIKKIIDKLKSLSDDGFIVEKHILSDEETESIAAIKSLVFSEKE